jgi:signal transduction histidine kinase/DNA-binding response OmpR family regulator
MTINGKIKKEVSCKPLIPIINAAKAKNIDLNRMLEGIPYDLSYLSNRHERIEWWVYCKIISNLRPYFNYSDFEQIGRDFVKKEHYIEGFIFHFMFFSVSKIARIAKGPVVKAGKAMINPFFSCITPDWEYIGKNKIRISMYISRGYEQCPEWYYMSIGVMKELGSTVGLKSYRFDHICITSNVGSCEFSLGKEGFFTGLKKWAHWLFNIRKAFVDLTESHEELSNNYNKLEESKKLLQRQTTQLKTAYNITKSIRKSFDVNKTLNTIVRALVDDAGLSSARIRMFKDIEGNKFEAEAFDGINEMNISTAKHPIVINDEKIGELTICPRIDTDITEMDELLRYLIPMINISIHDSLVLKTITDYRNNLEIKVDERTTKLKEAQDKLSEIIQAQSRFFANISHEFRTPLTLILGPIQKWKQLSHPERSESRRFLSGRAESKDVQRAVDSERASTSHDKEHRDSLSMTQLPDELHNDLSMAERNAHRLLTLINQLLDLSKLEAGAMKLRASQMNIVPLVKGIANSFESSAGLRGIALNVYVEEEEIEVYCDKDMVEKILSNLLSNAFKFTPEGGKVTVALTPVPSPNGRRMSEGRGEGVVEISVSDTGIGITPVQLDKVFDRFYQVDASQTREHEGSGLGLALVKELVELHHGTISVQSEIGRGTTFTVQLPLGRGHLRDDEIVEAPACLEPTMREVESIAIEKDVGGATEVTESEQPKTDKPIILVVEDNTDVRAYIKSYLIPVYQVTEARDGAEGIEIALEMIPDLIISDVMMPKKDGYQLCQTLKSDEKTSHIPIILLTAKAASENKIEGLETGADEYLIKPFEPNELLARVKNLIDLRRKLRERFKASVPLKPGEVAVTSMDDAFLKKVMAAVEQHMGDEHFHVEGLAAEVGMSRVQLFRKLTALTSQSPGEFIRYIRLHRAMELLQKDFGTVSEIAYTVGFSDPSYFSKCFHKQFGKAPTDVRKSPVPTELSSKASQGSS